MVVQTPYYGRSLTATILLFFQLGGDGDSRQSTMSSERLTENAISSLCNLTDPPTDNWCPVVQLIDLQKMSPEKKPSQVVWRLVLADGRFVTKEPLELNWWVVDKV